MRLRIIVSICLVGGGVIFHSLELVQGWAGKAVLEVPAALRLPPWKRSALYLGGLDFAEFIGFVRDHTAPDSRVVLPPRFPERAESNVGLMQFFLFPRDIHNCGINEVEECVRRIGGENSYILALADFPPRDVAMEKRVFIRFDDERGLFGPP